MPGDPRECVRHAAKLLDMASREKNEGSKKTLLHLADTWMKLARDLENAQQVLRNAEQNGS